MKYAVDIPLSYSDEWEFVELFETEKQAINFCKEKFGADKKGRINLITPTEEDDDFEDDKEFEDEKKGACMRKE